MSEVNNPHRTKTLCSSRSEHPRGPGRARAAHALAPSLLLTLALALLTSQAAAQTPETSVTSAATTDPPVVAVHYQDLTADDSATIDVFIPPPAIDWHEFTYAAAPCLKADGVLAGQPEKALILRFGVEGEGACATKVDLLFTGDASSWAAAAIVVVNRLPPLPQITGLHPTFRSGQIRMPYTKPLGRHSDLMLLGLTNTGSQPLTVVGFGSDEAFASLVGQAFSYEPSSFYGRYEDLLENGAPFEPTVVSAGSTAHFALIVDANGRLPDGAATITMQPVALIDVGGQLHTLSFPRLSAAWGTELP